MLGMQACNDTMWRSALRVRHDSNIGFSESFSVVRRIAKLRRTVLVPDATNFYCCGKGKDSLRQRDELGGTRKDQLQRLPGLLHSASKALSKLQVFICGNRGFSRSIGASGHSPGAVNQAVTLDKPLTQQHSGSPGRSSRNSLLRSASKALSKLQVFVCGNRGFSRSIGASGHSPGAVNQAVTPR